jgi:hypothetical protein
MSIPINDGGPAFPCESYGHRNGKQTTVPAQGMTLRDYFAAQALAGMLINYTTQKFGVGEQTCAKGAYEFADAMLAAREGKQ